MDADDDRAAVRAFYHRAREAGTAVQHILYAPEDVHRFGARIADGTVPDGAVQCPFVLGGHGAGQDAGPAPFLAARDGALGQRDVDWAVCAFGPRETACLLAAHRAGG